MYRLMLFKGKVCLHFDGGLLQYIGWSILGSLVTLCTLGIVTLGQLQ